MEVYGTRFAALQIRSHSHCSWEVQGQHSPCQLWVLTKHSPRSIFRVGFESVWYLAASSLLVLLSHHLQMAIIFLLPPRAPRLEEGNLQSYSTELVPCDCLYKGCINEQAEEFPSNSTTSSDLFPGII